MTNQNVELTAVSKDGIPEILFWKDMISFPNIISDSWQTSLSLEEALEATAEYLPAAGFRELRGDFFRFYTIRSRYKLMFTYKLENVFVTVASERSFDAKEIVSELRTKLPEAAYEEENTLQVKFHFTGSHGPSYVRRKLDMVTWEDIRDNYTEAVKANLDKLMAYTPDDITAKLILWYGVPGTGKSFSIHSLAWAWREWCSFEYITDPERFFGDAQYMLNLVLEKNSDEDNYPTSMAESDYYDESSIIYRDKHVKRKKDKWKLLILEDAGELIAEDAKLQTSSQALSRLLNMLDGFIGQGVKIMMLITTNEEIGKLNKAVSRSGRTLSKLEYKVLSKDEANAWLEKHELEGRVEGSIALSDLYAHLKNPTEHPLKSLTGFGLKK